MLSPQPRDWEDAKRLVYEPDSRSGGAGKGMVDAEEDWKMTEDWEGIVMNIEWSSVL